MADNRGRESVARIARDLGHLPTVSRAPQLDNAALRAPANPNSSRDPRVF